MMIWSSKHKRAFDIKKSEFDCFVSRNVDQFKAHGWGATVKIAGYDGKLLAIVAWGR